MVALHPFEYDYAPSQNINGLCNLPYSTSRIHYPMVRESYLRKLCKIRNFSQSPFGGFISEESDGNFPSGRN